MSIPGLGDVVTNLALARGSIQQAWDLVDQARTYAGGAEQALQDAEAETTRARMAPGGPLGASYLSRAGVQLDVLRQRCTLTANLAGQVEERLDTARGHVDLAREHLNALEQGPDLARGEAATLPGLHASVEAIREFLDLAARLAQATRRHLEQAAETANLLMTPSLADDAREHAVLRIDRAVQTAGRSVARAEEAARHLQRGVEYADTGTARSLTHADALANPTHPPGPDHQPGSGSRLAPPGRGNSPRR